jgi:hypothetical protein
MDEPKSEPRAELVRTPEPRVVLLLPTPAVKRDWSALVNRALDQLDSIADRIATAAGLR